MKAAITNFFRSPKRAHKAPLPARKPHQIQVGLDFGTSCCKCVWRDLGLDKARIHMPPVFMEQDHPFLVPSALRVAGKALQLGKSSRHYEKGGLPHVKMALAHIADKDLAAPILFPFAAVPGATREGQLASFVAASAVYLIAGIIGNVKAEIKGQFPDFGAHNQDYFGVSMAIPVANAEKPQVNALFHAVLRHALKHSDALAGHPPVLLKNLGDLVPPPRHHVAADEDDCACFIYPEVSAGIQGFIRSRVSKRGLYMFSDTGAGTVDQSVFIYVPGGEEGDLLTYLNASVLPLGSSQIEQIACRVAGGGDQESLELWRKLKEKGEESAELIAARAEVGERLKKESYATLFTARRKLESKPQFADIRIIFGGGGHCTNPYRECVLEAFDNNYLHGQRHVTPDVVGMPIPGDLAPQEKVEQWMRRLWVAYGLSFLPYDYPAHKYPCEMPFAKPEKVRDLPQGISKEMC